MFFYRNTHSALSHNYVPGDQNHSHSPRQGQTTDPKYNMLCKSPLNYITLILVQYSADYQRGFYSSADFREGSDPAYKTSNLPMQVEHIPYFTTGMD